MALTVAWVPTGMKIGVSMSPWGVVKEPRRAAPSCFSNRNWIAAKDACTQGRTPQPGAGKSSRPPLRGLVPAFQKMNIASP